MKNSFSLIELLFVLLVITLISSSFFLKNNHNELDKAVKRLELYLKHVRYQALIDNKKDTNNTLWHKKRWTLKFLRCRKSVGGIYYTIYSDSNMTGQPSLDESLNDPLTNKKIYSSNKCEETQNTSRYVLLTKEFGIESIDISCNSTSSIGQLSFGSDGKVFSKLSSENEKYYDYEIEKPCTIRFYGKSSEIEELIIEPKSAYGYTKK